MVVVPAGSYVRGKPPVVADPPLPDYGPRRTVNITRLFAIGRFDVTVDQYAAFARETKRGAGTCTTMGEQRTLNPPAVKWEDPGFPQTGRYPVVCVSFADAEAYTAWLSQRTGQAYRLPTDDEWEFAARGQTEEDYYWWDGPGVICDHANLADVTLEAQSGHEGVVCDDGYAHTSPVGRYPPNPFGLYDMAGNVAQWTSTCVFDDCGFRSTRGGAWSSDPADLRVTEGPGFEIDRRTNDIGFRIARDVGGQQ
jgi:formylglycine-generating enzyme required for sulfatase activity